MSLFFGRRILLVFALLSLSFFLTSQSVNADPMIPSSQTGMAYTIGGSPPPSPSGPQLPANKAPASTSLPMPPAGAPTVSNTMPTYDEGERALRERQASRPPVIDVETIIPTKNSPLFGNGGAK